MQKKGKAHIWRICNSMADSSSKFSLPCDALRQMSFSNFYISGSRLGIGAKGLLDSESVWSPTSPLDCRLFSNLSNPFSVKSCRSSFQTGHKKQLDGREVVGLGIISSLVNETKHNNDILGKFQRKSIIFGPQVKTGILKFSNNHEFFAPYLKSSSLPKNYVVSLPSETKTPNSEVENFDNVSLPGSFRPSSLINSNQNSNLGMNELCLGNASTTLRSLPLVTSRDSQVDKSLNINSNSLPISIDFSKGCLGSLSAREIELSEDYTCIISHGPNPKRTHIFAEIFIQTGYPLDLPSGSLGSYCIYEYHMPCSMGFATGGKTFFLWGGCMMMHADDFRQDRYGVVSGLKDGGYSDDMTLAAISGAHKRLITSPPVAVFPHPLASDLNFGRYWNYLRKQTFVLESYTTNVNWIMNRALFTTHCYLSWGFVAPYVMAMIHVAAALRFYNKEFFPEEITYNSGGLLLVTILAICTLVELLSMWNLTRIEVQLCNMLSPEAPQLSLASYNWCLVFIAMLVDNFLYPVSAFRSHLSQSINWSGIRYYLKDGKISKIERTQRSKDMGPVFTDLGGKHLYGKKGMPTRGSFLSSLSRSLAQWHQPKKFDN